MIFVRMRSCGRAELLKPEEPAGAGTQWLSLSPAAVPDKIYGVSAAAHTARALVWSADLCWPTLSLLEENRTRTENPQINQFYSKISFYVFFLLHQA